MSRLTAGLAFVLLLATGARAAVERYEVLGIAPAPEGTSTSAARAAALDAALAEAVLRSARTVLGDPDVPAGELRGVLGAQPTAYAVRYRVLEDRGARTTLVEGESTREWVLSVAVHVDETRVRGRLEEAGLASAVAAQRAGGFTVDVEADSTRAFASLVGALRAAGAVAVVPVELVGGRGRVRVEAPGSAETWLARIEERGLGDGLRLERLGEGSSGPRVRVHELPAGEPVEPLESLTSD